MYGLSILQSAWLLDMILSIYFMIHSINLMFHSIHFIISYIYLIRLDQTKIDYIWLD